MAVVNQYKFYGKTVTAAETKTLLSPSATETVIIKSLRVTNKSGSNAPTITIKNNAFEVVNTQSLSTATSVEIMTLHLIIERSTTLTATTAGTCTDGVVIGISYLNIKKDVVT